MTRQAVDLAPSTLPFGAMRQAEEEKSSWPGCCRKGRGYHSERPRERTTTFPMKHKEQGKDGVGVSWLWHGRLQGLA